MQEIGQKALGKIHLNTSMSLTEQFLLYDHYSLKTLGSLQLAQ